MHEDTLLLHANVKTCRLRSTNILGDSGEQTAGDHPDGFDHADRKDPRFIALFESTVAGFDFDAEDRVVTAGDAALLVVDDNEDNRYTLSLRLSVEGYDNLTTATNGREALDVLRSRPFDLVLLDIMMPDLNGYEV